MRVNSNVKNIAIDCHDARRNEQLKEQYKAKEQC